MTISEFAEVLKRRLRDDTGRQWTTEYLIEAINASFAALCQVIPQAYTEHRTLTLVTGTEQQIDEDLHRIVQLLHNVCPSTNAAKRAIIKAELSVMDRNCPQWRQDPARGYVWNYMLNTLDESQFYVWPPAVDGDLLRGVFTKTPCVVDGVAGFCGPEVIVPAFPTDPGPADPRPDLPADTYYTTLATGERLAALDPTLATEFALSNLDTLYYVLEDIDTAIIGNDVQVSIRLYPSYGPAETHGTFFFLEDDRVAPSAVRVKWGDPDLVPYAILKVQLVSGVARLQEVTTLARVTETDVCNYEAAVDDYYDLLYAKWLRDAACDGTLPAAPVAPVDPGPLGTGFSAPYADYDSVLVTANSLGEFYVEHRDGDAGVDFDVEFASPNDRIVIKLRDFQDTGTSESIDDGYQYVYPAGTVDDGTLNNPTRTTYSLTEASAPTLALRWNDVRFVEGQWLQCLWNTAGNDLIIEDFDVAVNEGTTQAQIDAYNVALAAYTIELAAYNAAVAAVPTATVGALTVADDLPFDKAHHLPLQEFALYYALMRDDEQTANSGRAMQHWQNFYQLLNKREDSDLMIKLAEKEAES